MDDTNDDFEVVEVVFTDEEDLPSVEERDEWWTALVRMRDGWLRSKFSTQSKLGMLFIQPQYFYESLTSLETIIHNIK